MRAIVAITRKEITIYFTSPMAYVVSGVFLALTGVFFIDSIDQAFKVAQVRGFLLRSSFFLLPLIPPLLTMRLFAEEQKLGTLELLVTAPVRDYEVVVAKFIASFIILSSTVLLTLFYTVILLFYGSPDIGPVVSGYLGGQMVARVNTMLRALSKNRLCPPMVCSFGLGPSRRKRK